MSRAPMAGKKQEKQGFPSSHGSTTGSTGAAKAPKPKKKKEEWKHRNVIYVHVSRYLAVLISFSRTLSGNIFPATIPKQSE